MPALATVMATSTRPEVRREAALALGAIGPAAASATTALSDVLGDGDQSVAAGAAYALGSAWPGGRFGPAGAGEMRRQLQSTAANDCHLGPVQDRAAQRGPAQRRGVAIGGGAWRASSLRFAARRRRAWPICKPAPELVLPAIEKVLRGSDSAAAANAVEALASLGEAAVPALIDALRIERTRPAVARLLGGMGPGAKKAAPALARIAVGDDSLPARCEALMALGAIGPEAAESVPAMVEALVGPNEEVCYAACYALGQMGPSAIVAQPELRKKLGDANDMIALSAAWRGADRSGLGPDWPPLRARAGQRADGRGAPSPGGGGQVIGLFGIAGQRGGARFADCPARQRRDRPRRCGKGLQAIGKYGPSAAAELK